METNKKANKEEIGTSDVKISTYRCGWCGQPTDENGYPLTDEECNELTDEQLSNAEMTQGSCCVAEQMYIANSMRVTRDMAIDAGDLSLEGSYI